MRPAYWKVRIWLLIEIMTLGAGNAVSQGFPPPQGPQLAEEPFKFFGTSTIINTVKNEIQTALDMINAQIIRETQGGFIGILAHVSFAYTTHAPGMSTTQYLDRPNENIVRIPFGITYDVTTRYGSRQLGQSIEVSVSCNNWFTNQGQVRITGRVERPFLDGTSFVEDVVSFFFTHTLADLVDSEIRRRLPGAFTRIIDLGGFACNRLGVTPGTAPAFTDGSINFKKAFIPLSLPSPSDVTVTFQSIKRLPARTLPAPGLGEALLYNEVEDIQVLLYANQTLRTAQLPGMREGDERNLSVEMVRLGRLGDSGLVLICTVEQLTTFQKDTRFSVFAREANFGNGTQKIIVQKITWQQPQRLPDGRLTKPTEHRVDAYEITVLVNAPQPVFR